MQFYYILIRFLRIIDQCEGKNGVRWQDRWKHDKNVGF